MTKAGGQGAANDATVATSDTDRDLVALRAKVERQRAHLAGASGEKAAKIRAHLKGAEAALAAAEKENG